MFTAFVGGAEADSPCFLRQIRQTYGMQAEVLLNRRIRFLGLNAEQERWGLFGGMR